MATDARPAGPAGPALPAARRFAAVRLVLAVVVVVAIAATAAAVNGLRSAPAGAKVVPVAHGSGELRVMVVGDSMAGTLGVGLARAAPEAGVTLINAATEGCGVSIAWDSGWASSIWKPGPPAYPCQNAQQLTAYWRAELQRYRPDVVLYANRMDTISQQVVPGSSDRMTSVLDPPFRAYLRNAFDQAVPVLTSTGAHLILSTSAPTKIGLKGSEYDNPLRARIYDAILRDVASRSGGQVSVFDLGRFFSGGAPVPTFTLLSPTGIQWRCRDGLHFNTAGGVIVAPALFTAAWRAVGGAAFSGERPPVPAAVADQPWRPYEAQKTVMGCGA